jgi:hypothetical protein
MESVGDECNVWMHESDELRDLCLKGILWVEHELDPSKETQISMVGFD